MAKLLKLRRGTTTQHASFTGAEGEVTIDTTKDTVVVHDNSTTGGTPLAKENMSNVSSTNIVGRIGTSALAGTKVQPNFGTQNIETDGNASIGGTNLNMDSAYIDFSGSLSSAPTTAAAIYRPADNSLAISTANTQRLLVNNSGASLTGNLDVSSGVDVTGNITVSGSVDGRDVASDGSKLDGIESGATGDQTATEILNAIKTVDGASSGLDADNLDGRTWNESASNSTIVSRNSSGYIFSNYINTTDNAVTSAVSGLICKQTNNGDYHRTANASAVRSFLNVENGATADQSDSEIATALRGQVLGTSSDGVHAIYCDDWFRTNSNGNGMYNQSTGQHWYSDSSSYWNMGGGSTNGGIRFRDNHASTVRGYIYYNNSNDVGLLNSAGSWSLKCDNSGNVTATGNVTAYSDRRLKTNINTINDALGIVGKLRGVSFDWKETGKHSIGVIAQEVEEVLPELVVTQDVSTEENPEKKEVKSVDYGKIVGVLINAINELKAEVDELKGGK